MLFYKKQQPCYCQSGTWQNKYLSIIRNLLFFMIVGTLQSMASVTYSQIATFSLDMQNATVAQVLSHIEEDSQFYFTYNTREVNLDREVSIQLEEADIKTILDHLFAGENMSYVIADKHIVLFKEGENTTQNSTQQAITITGMVTDEIGEPMIGVSVIIKGTTIGAVTDIDGKYSINVTDKNAVLTFSLIGYAEQQITVGEKTVINVVMGENIKEIDEVVVIGYGTVKKKDLTGSVARISPDSYKTQPVQDLSEMLRGNAPGVTVKTNGDGSTRIRVRGTNSLNGNNDPLYIVDGVPMGSYSPNDVESIEVLKDASATAIYGSRGANGVILITTKRGKIGAPRVEISAATSFATYPKFYDLLNGAEFADYYNSYFGRDIAFDKSVDTDWQKEITQTGIRQNYQASISGGGESMKYHVSGNYVDNTGLIKNQKNNSYRLRSNFDFKLNSKFTGRVDFSMSKRRSHGSGITGKGALLNALQWVPSVPIYDNNGEYVITDPYGITTSLNPYYEVVEGNDNDYGTSFTGNAYLAYEIIPGLKLSAQPSISEDVSEERNFTNQVLSGGKYNQARRSTNNTTTWQVTGLATYDKTLSKVHNINAMIGAEAWKTENDSYRADAEGVSYDYLEWYNMGSSVVKEISSGYSGAQLASFFARANYNYDSKYYITASIRADGSSKFQKANQFSYFPSGALGWVASNEDFLKGSEWLDHLKIRTSYGVTGSQAIDSYATLRSIRNRRNWSWGSGNRVQGIELNAPVNANLKWEETTQLDFGIDAIFMNKWSLSLDYYHKTTDGLLTARVLPEYAGGGSTMINLGEMQNQGVDFSLTYTPFKSNDFGWRMTLNASWMANKVVSLGDIGEYFIPGDDSNFTGVQLEGSPLIVQQGESLGQLYGYKWLGLWRTDEAEEAAKYDQKPGDNKYLDKNGNNEYDNEDREVLGNFMPKFIWSYNTTINWKDFDFNLLIEGAHGQDMYNYNRMLAGTVIGLSGSVNLREAAENVWTPNNQNTMWAPNSTSALEKANSSKWIENASWVKIRNISVGYTIPQHLMRGHQLRFNASVQNAFTITGYKGMDPEAAVNGGRNTDMYGGVEYGTFPSPRIYTIGLTYNF